jgi:lipopolysaccharide export system protein LptA
MKIFWIYCLMLGAGLALVAQTNSGPPTTEAPVVITGVKTETPSEVRPTEIQSHSGQFFMKSNVFVYRGDVRIDNPQMKLTCELLTIEAPKVDDGKFNRATAETNVVIDWTDDKGPNHATAAKAVYTYTITNVTKMADAAHFETNAFVVLTGNPIVTNVQGVFRGDPIIWDRINDTITSPNFLNMKINRSETNSPGLFEEPKPSKPKTSGVPK